MLAPIWDEAADKVSKEFSDGKVVVGKVDCDKHGKLLGDWLIGLEDKKTFFYIRVTVFYTIFMMIFYR